MLRLIILSLLSSIIDYYSTPFTNLCFTTSFLRYYTQSASELLHTEVSSLHGVGMANLPSLVAPLSLGAHFFNKLTLALFSLFLIL